MKRLSWILVGLLILVLGCGSNKADVAVDEPGDGEAGGLPPLEEPDTSTEPDMGTEPGFGVEDGSSVKDIYLEDVFFAYDKYVLTEESKRVLSEGAEELRNASKVRIIIEGHCDERGTIAYNLALGEKRARAAKQYLLGFGIDPSRIEIISYGKEKPFSLGHNEEAWTQNRRAHFVVDEE